MNKMVLFIALVVSTINPLGAFFYLPALPLLKASTGAPIQLAQFTLTSYILGMGISQIFYGYYADRFNRRYPLIIGLIIFAVSSCTCFFISNIYFLILGRVLQGIGAGAAFPLSMAILKDRFQGNNLAKVISYETMIFSLSAIVFPFLGGLFVSFVQWQYLFIAMALFGIVNIFLVLYLLPETKVSDKRKTIMQSGCKENTYKVSISTFIINFMLIVLCVVYVFSVNSSMPFFLKDIFNCTPKNVGIIFSSIGMGLFLGSFSNSVMLNYFKEKHLTRLGSVIFLICNLSVGICYLLSVVDLPLLIANLVCSFFAIGIIISNLKARTMSIFESASGKVAGLIGAVSFLFPSLFISCSILMGLYIFRIFIVYICLIPFLLFFINSFSQELKYEFTHNV